MEEAVNKTNRKKRKIMPQELAKMPCVNSFSVVNTKREREHCKGREKEDIDLDSEKPHQEVARKKQTKNKKPKNMSIEKDESSKDESISEVELLNDQPESDFDYEEVDSWCDELDEESSEKYASLTSQLETILKKMQCTSDKSIKLKKQTKTGKKPVVVLDNECNNEKNTHTKIARRGISHRQPKQDVFQMDERRRTTPKHIHFD